MSDRDAARLLAALRHTVRDLQLYPPGHPFTAEALASTGRAIDRLVGPSREVTLTLVEDGVYLGRTILSHVSLEYHTLLREMQDRGIMSITLLAPVLDADVTDLAMFVSGKSDDLPAGGTVRLNELPFSPKDLEASELDGLRRSYTSSLDVLRSVGLAIHAGGGIELSGAVWAVEGLVQQAMAQPGAALLLSTVKSHDEYTFFHSVNTCILALSLGRLVGLDEERLMALGLGAMLHDIGKVGVPASVLQHPGRLDSEQWEHIKRHPQEGAQAILAAAAPGQEVAAAVALEHHARVDGTGYPRVVSCDQHGHDDHAHDDHAHDGHPRELHFFSRLVSVADTYDAITTRRSYRRAETPNRALQVLLGAAGSSYDPDMVRAFIKLMGVYPPGSLLVLENGEIAMVTHLVDEEPDRPAAVLVRTADGVRLDVPEPIEVTIGQVIDQVLPDQAGIDPAGLLEQAEFVAA